MASGPGVPRALAVSVLATVGRATQHLKNGKLADAGRDARAALAALSAVVDVEDDSVAPQVVAPVLFCVGRCCRMEGSYNEAQRCLEGSLSRNRAIFGVDHVNTASAAWELHLLYSQMGKKEEDLVVCEEVVRIWGKRMHPRTGAAIKALAELYEGAKRYTEAEPLRRQLLVCIMKAMGPEHPVTAVAINDLAALYTVLGRTADALLNYQLALAVRRKALGPQHPHTITTIINLAALLEKEGRYHEALPHRQQILEVRMRDSSLNADTAKACNNLAVLLTKMGRYDDALPLQEQALELHRGISGRLHQGTAASASNLALIFQRLGRFDEALPLYQLAVNIWREIAGPRHHKGAAAVNNLAGLYECMGRFEDALPLYEAALAARVEGLGREHPDTVTSLANLASVLARMGQLSKALPMYLEALDLARANYGANDHPQTASLLNNLAEVYKQMGDYREAIKFNEESLGIRRRILDDDHPDIAQSLANLGDLHHDMGSNDIALRLTQEALTMETVKLGPAHPTTLTAMNNLATIYATFGRFADALSLHQCVLRTRERNLGALHPNTLASINNVALTHSSLGNFTEAQRLLEKAVDTMSTISPDHPQYVAFMANLAGLYNNLGSHAESLELSLKVLDYRTRVLGPEHPDTVNSANNLSYLYFSLGRYQEGLDLCRRALHAHEAAQGKEQTRGILIGSLAAHLEGMGLFGEALPLRKESLDISKGCFGDKHPSSLSSLDSLASLYHRMGDYHQALTLHLEVLEARKAIYCCSHPSVAKSLNNVATLRLRFGDYVEARALLTEALTATKDAMGALHPDTANLLSNLATLSMEMGRTVDALQQYQEAYRVRKQVLGLAHPDTAGSLNGFVTFLGDIGRKCDALALSQQVHRIRLAALGPMHPDTLQSIANMACFLDRLGNEELVLRLHEHVLAARTQVLGEWHVDTAICRQNLALLMSNMGRKDEALPIHNAALSHLEKALGKSHLQFARFASVNGLLQFRCDNTKAALAASLDVGRIELALLHQMIPFLGPQSRIQWLQRLPNGYMLALQCLTALARDAVANDSFVAVAEWTLHRKDVAMASQRLLRRLMATSEASELVEELRRLRELQALGWPGHELIQRADDVEELLQARHPALKEALERSYLPLVQAELRCKNGVLFEYVADGGILWIVCISSESIETCVRVSASESHVKELVRKETDRMNIGPAGRGAPAGFLEQLEEEDEDHYHDVTEAIDTANSRELFDLLVAPMLSHLEGVDHVFISPVSHLHQLAFEVLRTPRDRYWVDELSDRDCHLSYLNVGRQLADFQDAAWKDISPGPPVVIGAPEFDSISAEEQQFLAEDTRRMEASYALLGTPRENSDSRPLSLQLQRDLQGEGRATGFSPLYWAREEADDVAALLRVEAVVGEKATRRRLLSVRHPIILHVATHGWCAPSSGDGEDSDAATSGIHTPYATDNDLESSVEAILNGTVDRPCSDTIDAIVDSLSVTDGFRKSSAHPLLRSALLMAGTNAILSCDHLEARQAHQLPHCSACGKSGLVTALEVAELDLFGTELVVLSACSSGFGITAQHEGHLGLRSALHQAGARAALVSLWPVPDGWTRTLMVAFYRRLVQEGQGRLEALRGAQAEIRSAGAPTYAWAAFILVGDPSPLPEGLNAVET